MSNVKVEKGDETDMENLTDDQVVFHVTAFRKEPNDDQLGCGIEFGEDSVEARLEAIHVVMNILDQTRVQLEHQIIHTALEREQKMRKARRDAMLPTVAEGKPN